MSKQTKTYLSTLVILQIMVAAVLIISFIPREAIPSIFGENGNDKLVHLAMYGTFSIVIAAVLWQFPIRKWALISIIACTSIGIAIEFLQPILSNRSLDIHDIIFNTLGICVGVCCAYGYKHRSAIMQAVLFVVLTKLSSTRQIA